MCLVFIVMYDTYPEPKLNQSCQNIGAQFTLSLKRAFGAADVRNLLLHPCLHENMLRTVRTVTSMPFHQEDHQEDLSLMGSSFFRAQKRTHMRSRTHTRGPFFPERGVTNKNPPSIFRPLKALLKINQAFSFRGHYFPNKFVVQYDRYAYIRVKTTTTTTARRNCKTKAHFADTLLHEYPISTGCCCLFSYQS